MAYYPLIKNREIVQAQVSNFGLKTSLFQEPASLEAYLRKLWRLLSEDVARS